MDVVVALLVIVNVVTVCCLLSKASYRDVDDATLKIRHDLRDLTAVINGDSYCDGGLRKDVAGLRLSINDVNKRMAIKEGVGDSIFVRTLTHESRVGPAVGAILDHLGLELRNVKEQPAHITLVKKASKK